MGINSASSLSMSRITEQLNAAVQTWRTHVKHGQEIQDRTPGKLGVKDSTRYDRQRNMKSETKELGELWETARVGNVGL